MGRICVGADLSEAWLYATIFADNDLSLVKGLDTVIHAGPSTIDIETQKASMTSCGGEKRAANRWLLPGLLPGAISHKSRSPRQ